jgi:hypothetical protein
MLMYSAVEERLYRSWVSELLNIQTVVQQDPGRINYKPL